MAILITKLVCLHSWWLAVIWKKTTYDNSVTYTWEHTHTLLLLNHICSEKEQTPYEPARTYEKKTLYESFYRPGKQRQPCTFEWCTWNNTHDFAHVDKANAIDISWRLRLRWIWLDLQGDFESSCDNLKDKATIWNPHLTLKPPHPLALACIQFHPESITSDVLNHWNEVTLWIVIYQNKATWKIHPSLSPPTAGVMDLRDSSSEVFMIVHIRLRLKTGWWFKPLWKMIEFVSWDDDIPNTWKIKNVPNHQPENRVLKTPSLHQHLRMRISINWGERIPFSDRPAQQGHFQIQSSELITRSDSAFSYCFTLHLLTHIYT